MRRLCASLVAPLSMLTTFCSEVASCPVLTVPPARAANGEFLDVEEEANLGWQEPPPIFKHRDVMIFPRGTQGQTSCPAYRQEAIDAQKRHNGTHPTRLFDFKGPRARHRTDFLREVALTLSIRPCASQNAHVNFGGSSMKSRNGPMPGSTTMTTNCVSKVITAA